MYGAPGAVVQCRPVKVCHLIKGLGRGGAEQLLPQVIACGHGAHAVGYFLPWKDALVPTLRGAGVPVRCFGSRNPARMLLAARAVAGWLREERADLVHCHLPLAGVVGRLAGRMAGVPVVYTEHNLQPRYHPATRRANAWTWRLQRAVVAVSQEVADSIAEHVGHAVPVRVVKNGIDVAGYAARPETRAATRQRLGIPPDAPVVGTVAVFRRQKRLDQWLEAAAQLVQGRGPAADAHFLLVGDGPLRAEVEAQVAALGLGGRVHLPGLQEDVRPFFAAMDLFLSSSEFEGLPLALLEAMAAGLPPVVTAVGGVPEVVQPGQSGVLAPFGDPALLAREAARLIVDAPERGRLGAGATARVREAFGVERMAAELAALYEEVLAVPA